MTKTIRKRVLPMFACFLEKEGLQIGASCPPFIFRDIKEAERQFADSAPEGYVVKDVHLAGFFDPLTGKCYSVPTSKKQEVQK